MGGGTPSRIAWPPLEYGGGAGAPSRSDLEFEVRFSGALINGTPVTGSPGQYTFTVPFGTHDIEIRAFVRPGTTTNSTAFRSHYGIGRASGINIPGQGSAPVPITMQRAGDSAANPFMIYNEFQLRRVGRGGVNPLGFQHWTLGSHYRLIDDITLTGGDWEPIGPVFSGSFNGGGFSIGGLTINNTTLNDSGMFAENSGTIENLNLPGVNITNNAWGHHGSVAGVNNLGIVRRITVSGNVSAFATGVFGGVVGFNTGTVENSDFTGTISVDAPAGGVVGHNWGTVERSSFSGTLSSNTSSHAGGVVAFNFGGTVTNNRSSGTVSGLAHVGGVVGHNDGIVQNSFSLSTVSAIDHSAGGLAGSHLLGTIQNSVALNQSITRSSGGDTHFARLYGNNTLGTGTNNHARAGMVFIDGAIPQPDFPVPVVSDPTGFHGADVSPGTHPSQFNNQSFWETTLGWDFTNIWQMQGSPPLPALRPPQ